jgi:hypothetical protein
MSGVDADPRWEKLMRTGVACEACGQTHTGLFDLARDKPDSFPAGLAVESNAALRLDGDFLSSDFCISEGEHFAVRTVLELPIIGSDTAFAFGVWSSLSRDNFERYVESFNAEDGSKLGRMFSWLLNDLKPYQDTYAMKCMITPRNAGQRPTVEVENSNHSLSEDQRNGITLDRLLDIYAAHGHDLRASLGAN